MRQSLIRYGGIGLILLVALGLRVLWLADFPSGLQNDEASFFYNAKLLAETGKDEDGRVYPLYLNSFIDPKPALYAYLQIPLIKLWGDSIWAARLPGALMGVISVGLVYWLLALLGVEKDKRILISLLLMVSPWHILVSRGTQEVIMSFGFGLMALIAVVQLFFRPDKHQGKIALMWGGIFGASAALAVYSYHSTKIMLPLLIIWLWWLWPGWRKESYWRGGWVLTGWLIIGLVVTTNQGGMKRLSEISLWSDDHTLAVTQEQISLATGKLPKLLIRGFHNKVITMVHTFGKNYLTHLDPKFLFFDESQPQRYVVYNQGLMYSFEWVGLLLGLWVVLGGNKSQRRRGLFFLGWWALAPLPAAITNQEIPSLIRTFWMVIPLVYFGYFGWEWLIRRAGKPAVIGLAILYLFSLTRWIESYTILTPNHRPWSRNVADSRMAEALQAYGHSYDRIVIERFSGQPYIYLALNGLISPGELQATYPLRTQPDFEIGKFDFKAGNCPVAPKEKILFAVHANCILSKDYRVIDRQTYADGNDGYVMVEWEGK